MTDQYPKVVRHDFTGKTAHVNSIEEERAFRRDWLWYGVLFAIVVLVLSVPIILVEWFGYNI